ncbi:MAG: antA/AntB antirepressor family protein [Clostridium sp.]
MKKFTKQFLSDVLALNDEEVKLVMECQRKFPELLLNSDDMKINSVKKLYSEMELNKAHWARWYSKNIINNEFFKEDKDWEVVTLKATTEKGGQVGKDFSVSIEFAKHLTMQGKSLNSHKIRSYFILIEKSVKGIQEHIETRSPEKIGYNKMKKHIEDWCDRNGYDKNIETFYTREANLINKSLTGLSALEIKLHKGYKDRVTREHLEIPVNKAIIELQRLNSSLLMANLDFDTRKEIIEATCKNEYNYIKEMFKQ